MKIPVSLIIGSLLYSLISSCSAFALNCENPQTQIDINQCTANDLDMETKKLNRTYGDFRAKLNVVQKQQIKEAQLAWIKFKDLACRFEASGVKGGSVYPMVLAHCLIEKTRQRNKELEILSTCQEGDLNCPAW